MGESAPIPIPSSARGGRERPEPGFTLIEILVVMLLLGIILAMIGVNLAQNPSDAVRAEAERLAALLQAAQQESIFQGRPYAVEIATDGYRFLRLNDGGKLASLPLGDVLAPRTLPVPVAIAALRLEGTTEDEAHAVVLDPSGALNPFTVVLESGDVRWFVHGYANGRIEASNEPLPG